MAEEITLPETKKRKFRVTESAWFRLGIAAVVVGLLVGAVGASGYFYRAYKKTLSEKDSLLSQMTGKTEVPEVESVVASISKLIELPQGETPTLATVSDKSKLESQAFFKRAENGDKVLIYTNAGKAILYRPSTGRVVDMTAVNMTPEKKSEETTPTPPDAGAVAGEQDEANTDTQTETQNVEVKTDDASANGSSDVSEKPFSVAIVNGTTTSGLAKKTGETIRGAFSSATIMKTSDAKKKEYSKTVIVDVSGKFSEEAKRLAELLNGDVGVLPDGEAVPDGADIFVVVGGMTE